MDEKKIIVIGAAGVQAGAMLESLARAFDMSRVTAVDRRWPAATQERVLGLGASIETLDVLAESERLIDLARSADVLVNLAGPFFRLGDACINAAIAAGIDYLDICDDVDATRMLLDRHEDAQASGTRALIGMGSTPGASNVMVRAAVDAIAASSREMSSGEDGGSGDVVTEVDIAWTVDQRDMSTGVAAHMLHSLATALDMTSSDPRVPEWGALEPRFVDFPEPVGENLVLRLGHPEPVTIPQFLPGTNVVNSGTIAPEENIHVLWALGRLLGTAQVDELTGIYDEFVALSRRPAELHGSGLMIDVQRDGSGYRFASGSHMTMERSTGVPAAAGVLTMLSLTEDGGSVVNRIGIEEPGVHAPECLRPRAFFESLGKVSEGGGGMRVFRLKDGSVGDRVRMRDLLDSGDRQWS